MVLLCLAMALPVLADDDFLDHYKAGLAALGRKEWTVAATRMRQALEGKRDEDARLARRLYLKRYLPHYLLGRALFESGDCAGALAAWGESERQGVVRQFEEFRQLQRDREVCQQRLAAAAEADSALTAARQRVTAAEQAARRVGEVRQSPDGAAGWGSGEPSLASRESAALELLAAARTKLPIQATAADLPRIREASDLASQALAQLETIERDSRELPTAAAAEPAVPRSTIEGQIKIATTLLANHRFLEPYPPEVTRRREELETAVATAQGLPATADSAQVSAASQALLAAQNRLRKAVALPPEGLQRAAEAYFRGDYAVALEQLAQAEFSEKRASAHAALFRAAASFGLWAASGETDAALLEAARAAIRDCQAADPKRVPATTAFSPRFVELFTRETSTNRP